MLHEIIGLPAMLEQTAEELTEFAQACLKYARYLRGENPTYKDESELRDNLHEEAADVIICMDELPFDGGELSAWVGYKKNRMKERFKT